MLARLATAGAAVALLTAAFTSPATAAPALQISVASVNGSGCPLSGPAPSVTIGQDGTVTAQYSNFTARRGNGAPISESRRNCILQLRVTAPQGYTYTVSGAQFAGTRALSGAGGSQNTSYYFQGGSATTLPHALNGSGSFATADTAADLAPLGAAPCGVERTVSLNTDLRVAGTGSVALNSTTAQLSAVPCA